MFPKPISDKELLDFIVFLKYLFLIIATQSAIAGKNIKKSQSMTENLINVFPLSVSCPLEVCNSTNGGYIDWANLPNA